MLPYGWIPEDGAEFSRQFIDNLKLIWLQLCDSTKEHLSEFCLMQGLENTILQEEDLKRGAS